MQRMPWVALALAVLIAIAAPASAQEIYFTNVRFEDGTARGTLVNGHTAALSAWAVDVIDAGGRPLFSVTADATELTEEFVPARGTRLMDLPASAGAPAAIVFRAALDEEGRGIGDPETVGRLREARAIRTARQAPHAAPSRR